jgi:hypothetical protein
MIIIINCHDQLLSPTIERDSEDRQGIKGKIQNSETIYQRQLAEGINKDEKVILTSSKWRR